MKLLTDISRLLTGSLFIVSGLIKANDPTGFGYKLKDYFASDVLNMEWLIPYSLTLAVMICLSEIILGAMTLFGVKMKPVSLLLLAMIVFFTFLTFYSAYFDKVTDCGCFGDALKLTPWQSFQKDLVLLVFVMLIFIKRKEIQPNTISRDITLSIIAALIIAVFSFGVISWGFPVWFALLLFTTIIILKVAIAEKLNLSWIASGAPLIFTLLFTFHVLNHLPIRDFRPYAVGKSISEGMKDCVELQLPCTEYEVFYTLKNTVTGEKKKVNSQKYISEKIYEDKTWELLSDETESVMIKKGYEPPIHDFSITTTEGEDKTMELLSDENYSFLLISYNIKEANMKANKKINALADACQQAGYNFTGLTASSYDAVEDFRHEVQTMYPYYSADEKNLQTIVRSNPALLMLKKGVVVGKWHYNDIPDLGQLQKIMLNK